LTTAPETDDRLLIPNADARHQLGGIGNTKFCELINNRELERVNIGRRSFVTAASLHAYVERLRNAARPESAEPQTAGPVPARD
jgi:hypothetical protein